MVQAALQKRGAEARSALVWAAVMGDAEAAAALLGRGEREASLERQLFALAAPHAGTSHARAWRGTEQCIECATRRWNV